MALESVAKTHNEIFIGLKSGYLAGFKLFDGYAILLLTDKKINFPMVSMGIKSASEMLKQHLEEERKDLERRNQIVKTGVESIDVAPTNEKLIPVLHQYVYILTEFLGPAAKVVVNDALEQWKGTYVQSPNNLPYLVVLLENKIETTKEKHLFKAKIDRVTTPDM